MGRRRTDLATRFWAKVEQGPPEDHWWWLGGKNAEGYGYFWDGERSVPARRVAWELGWRRKPNGEIHVNCGERDCVNPNHLEEV